MISNIKRYNSTIQILTKTVRKALSSYSNWKSNMYLYTAFDSSLFEAGLALYFNLDYNALIVDQDKNKDIFIGLDLNKVYLMSEKNGTRVAQCVVRTVEYSRERYSYYDDLMREISPETKDTINEYNAKNTEFYKRLFNHVINLSDSVKINATLDEGQFPTLQNRKLLPLVIIKVQKNQINFTNNMEPKSFKSDRIVYDIREVLDSGKMKFLYGSLSIPSTLVKIQLSGGHINRTD